MTDLIFLDTETTGLDSDLHEIWEIAYAINDGPIVSFVVPHDLASADPAALEMNGYYERSLKLPPYPDYDRNEVYFKRYLQGNTIVGANPAFDARFLKTRWGIEPWHYRMIDVETMAMTIFEWPRPKGLKDIRDHLAKIGYEIPAPTHSAAADVQTTRNVYNILRALQNDLCNSVVVSEAEARNTPPY